MISSQVIARAAYALALVMLPTGPVIAIEKHPTFLAGTLFETVADEFELNAVLLYAVSLAESARGVGDGKISPWPYTLRTLDQAFYFDTLAEADDQLATLMASHSNVDVGIGQISLRWNGDRVTDPGNLLNPEIGLRVCAEILSETIASAPGDLELGVGRYHHWADENRARNYGSRVLAIVENLRAQ